MRNQARRAADVSTHLTAGIHHCRPGPGESDLEREASRTPGPFRMTLPHCNNHGTVLGMRDAVACELVSRRRDCGSIDRWGPRVVRAGTVQPAAVGLYLAPGRLGWPNAEAVRLR